MDGFVIFVFIGAAVLISLAMLWYLIQTVRIIWTYNALLAFLSVIFSPIVHVVFYFMHKDDFDQHEAGLFKKYFISLGLIALLGIMAAVLIPATLTQDPVESFSGKNNLARQESVTDQESFSDEELAEQGDVAAQFRLGLMYYEGDSVRQDYVQAKKWYQKAAEQGNPGGAYYLGTMYYEGEGVSQDYTQAKLWLEKAANQGMPNAQYNLGVMYFNGEGVRQDYVQAKEWMGKACDNGLQMGCDKYKSLN